MWKKVEYTKRQINEAGRTIIKPDISPKERDEALAIIDNWRAAHAFPMNTFAITLKKKTQSIPDAIVVQRLKRLNTITHKLERFPTMELYRMQDLGGCRVIVPTIENVYKVKMSLRESRIRHIEHNVKDYIATPNPNTGYRGVHVIYRYKSERSPDYNGLQVEIQIRTKLQHLWATAVETVGVFTQNGLKFNQGSDRWLHFFKVVSALFSVEEKSAIVDGVDTNPVIITHELVAIIDELNVIEKLYTIGLATSQIGKASKSKKPGYYLLILNIDKMELTVTRISGVERATEEYNAIESSRSDSNIDAVLVSASSFEALTSAYPNYFADIKEFTHKLVELIKKYA